jgi:hypothetical protein
LQRQLSEEKEQRQQIVKHIQSIRDNALRANIDETVLLVVITEQGENRNQCEEQRNLFGFPHGFARRGT